MLAGWYQNANFFNKPLWIDHAGHSRRSRLISDWLNDIGYTQEASTNGHKSGTIDLLQIKYVKRHINLTKPTTRYRQWAFANMKGRLLLSHENRHRSAVKIPS